MLTRLGSLDPDMEEIKTTKQGLSRNKILWKEVEIGLTRTSLCLRDDHHLPYHGHPLGGGEVVGHEHLPEV